MERNAVYEPVTSDGIAQVDVMLARGSAVSPTLDERVSATQASVSRAGGILCDGPPLFRSPREEGFTRVKG